MKALLPNIWEWSWFSEEKQLNFNGHFLTVGEHRIIVDPPPMSANDIRFARQGGPVDYIILTNRDHEREAGRLREEFHCTVMAPELDAQEMSITIDKTFKDGELLPGGIWSRHPLFFVSRHPLPTAAPLPAICQRNRKGVCRDRRFACTCASSGTTPTVCKPLRPHLRA